MKSLSFLAIGALCLALGACGHRKIEPADYERVRAGMTYAEVETTLSSKPAEIRQGGTILAFSEDTQEYEHFARLGTPATRLACLTFLNQVIDDTMHWRVPAVRGMGQLAYTTWVMPDAPRRNDTLKVAIPIIVPDTVYEFKEVGGESHSQMVINEYGKVSVGFVYYVVESQYCIIFESPSGRVTECRFLPQTVERIQDAS